jgi:DNA-binding CsgD family transcriptional regulator
MIKGGARRDWQVTADDDAIARLTEAQREVLRLVMIGYQSKEIAQRLGIGVDAVNKRLAAAKSALGAPTRFAAARRLAEHEAGDAGPLPVPPAPSHWLVGQPLAVEQSAPRPDDAGQDATGNQSNVQPVFQPAPRSADQVADHQRSYGTAGPAAAPVGPAAHHGPGIGAGLEQALAGLLATPGRVFAATLLIGAAAALARHL